MLLGGIKMVSKKRLEYNNAYNKQKYKNINFRVNKEDTEILEKIKSVPNKAKYLTDLIRQDIKKSKN